jgi:hypothetical protein
MDTRPDLDAIQNGIQFRVAVHAQTSEFSNQRTKHLSPRSVQQTDHVQLHKSEILGRDEHPRSRPALLPPWLTMMLMVLSRRRGCGRANLSSSAAGRVV